MHIRGLILGGLLLLGITTGSADVYATSYTSDSDYGNSYYQYSRPYDTYDTHYRPYSYSYDRNRDAHIEDLINQLNDLIDQLERIRDDRRHYDYYDDADDYYGDYDDYDDYNSHPDVNTDEADDISDEDAELRGSVDMRDFNDGLVFFVYGEDEEKIQDIERDYDTYADIDEDGDDLQKVRVDTSLDNEEDYTHTIRDLNDNTDYFFSICVAYEDENNDDTIRCGNVEHFETD